METLLLFSVLCGLLAARTDCPPEIDGILNDSCWTVLVPEAGEFTAFRPRADVPLSQPTEIRIAYDDYSLYLACFMHDPDPSRINHQIGARDEDQPVDKLYIYLDTFNDDSNCFVFTVTVDGVQLDSRRTEIGGEDRNWDAVWNSAVCISDSGWSAEIALPFSALRYSSEEVQLWGINFGRTISCTNEAGYLFRMDEYGGTDASCFGDLTGLRGLPSGHGIEIRPFISGRLQFRGDEGIFNNTWGSGGADIKIPLSMQSVMDVTVYPDFGQVESDADQGNISHWDPWLAEKRPFFMEGAEIFDMPFNMFYSRRIGSVAWNGELIPVLGGAKITGTSGSLRYGALEVVTGSVWENDTTILEPVTSYWVGSILNEFSQGNWVKLSTTSADAPGGDDIDYTYGRSASLCGMLTPVEHIELQGKLGLTWNRFNEDSDNAAFRIDAGYFRECFDMNFRIEKKGEDFSPGFMGYIGENAVTSYSVYSSVYRDFTSGFMDGAWFDVCPVYRQDSEGRNAGSGVSMSLGGASVSRYDLNMWADYTDRRFDRYEGPNGRWYPDGFSSGFSSSTDYRRPVVGWVSFSNSKYLDSRTEGYYLGLRLKPFPELFINLEPSLQIQGAATRYNWSEELWERTSSNWKSLNVSASYMLTPQMRIRATGQASRFDRNWETESSSSVSRNIWGNILYSWEYCRGSWFHFLVGELSHGDEDPQFTIYAKLTRYI